MDQDVKTYMQEMWLANMAYTSAFGIAKDGRPVLSPYKNGGTAWGDCEVDVCNGVTINGTSKMQENVRVQHQTSEKRKRDEKDKEEAVENAEEIDIEEVVVVVMVLVVVMVVVGVKVVLVIVVVVVVVVLVGFVLVVVVQSTHF